MDKACTQEITDSLEHSGTLEVAKGDKKELVVENPVQNVYLKLSEGEQYRIERADQLVKHATRNGYYEIAGDLDFTDLAWPLAFSAGTFSGKFYGKDGAAVTLSNITATYASSSKFGGLFGKISEKASMQDITFNNVTVDLFNTGTLNNEASYGLFAGEIEEGATLSVTLENATLKIGAIGSAADLQFHLLANGSRTGVTANGIGLVVYGTFLYEDADKGSLYQYTVQHDTVEVADDGTITFAFYPSLELLNEKEFIIQ